MTHDELIAAGVWSGPVLEIRKRMAEYLVDGVRFGGMELKTKTASPNDTHLEKRVSEITTAALMFSYLKYESVGITSFDSSGKQLERPDLDVTLPDGSEIGVEVADVSDTDLRKHESGRNEIEIAVSDLLDSDHSFGAAMGNTYFSLNLNGVGAPSAQLASKSEARVIAEEIVAFVRTGDHRVSSNDFFASFPVKYPTLHGRAAQYHAEPWPHDPVFTLSDGAGTIGKVSGQRDLERVLNRHRVSAKVGYRNLPTWIVLFLTDPFEFFYNTIGSVQSAALPIDPFVRVCIMDAVARVLLIEKP